MSSLPESAIALFVGLLFTSVGCLKLYGFWKGYEGGPGKSFWQKLRAGTCPEGHCRLPRRIRKPFYLSFSLLFLAFGLYSLIRFCLLW